MIRHIYLINLKEGADVQAAIDKMMSLKEHIPYMKAIECGVDFKGDSNSWQVCEMCTFETREDFVKFGSDPYHAEVRKYMANMIAQGAKIDYEI
ncbi:MAG: Dabb family protein [Oscillospiraceae bacterium]|nr:Dabb family protein [Oscillospiraceae bacterium]